MSAPTLVGGRYRLGRMIGSGGTAAVYEGEDLGDGGAVAIKILHPELAANSQRWSAFFEEVRAAGVIDHPGVISIRADGVDVGTPPTVWIVMELVHGVTIRDAVRLGGPLSAATALAIADALLHTIESAHQCGVVHRDITPANVMFDPEADADGVASSVRLLDFGVADISGRTMAGADALLSSVAGDQAGVVVNVPYASPEQLQSLPVTERSDLYQVGATIFFALVGHPPGPDGPPPRGTHGSRAISEVREVAGESVAQWLAMALQPNPASRYRDAVSMRRALDALTAAAGSPPRAHQRVPVVASSPAFHTQVTRVMPTERADRTRVFRPGSGTAASLASAHPHAGQDSPRRALRAGWMGAAALLVAVPGIIGIGAAAQSLATPAARPSPLVSVTSPPSGPMSQEPAVTTSVVMPSVEGLSRAEAESVLSTAGLVVADVRFEDGTTSWGAALRTDPAAGTRRAPASAVVLFIASGSNVVPPVAGLAGEAAIAAVRQAGFTVGDHPLADGVATTTWPAPGSVLLLGSTVSISVDVAHISPLPDPSPLPSSAPTSTPTPPAPEVTPSPVASPAPSPTEAP